MTDEQIAVNLFDKIRDDADKKRQARIEQEQKTSEYFDRIKSGYNPLDEINQKLNGEIKNEKSR